MKREWYLSFHGGAGRDDLNNIHVYSADGEKLRKALDNDHLPAHVNLRELRGLTFGPDGCLYVANAYQNYSQVLRFHDSLDKHGQHPFRDVFVESDAERNPGLSHPFGLVFDPHGDLYVTSQNTNLVLRYHGPKSSSGVPGTPMPLPPALAEARLSSGTFCAAAAEAVHGLQAVRAALFARGRLYVADRDADCVRKYESDTGAYLGEITARGLIDKPIQLTARGDVLYIGNRARESVVQCDLQSETVAPFILPHAGGLNNPSGLAVGDDGYFYVASRSTKQVLRYQLADGQPEARPFIDHLDDEPEFIVPVNRA